jgi:two-component system alkaline phosphatase synthesis response regulator PhoP
VVEDDINIAQLVQIYLEDAGYEVYLASDGNEALTLFKEKPPSLVILDIMLPGRDGFEVCKEIRKSSSCPIIVLSAKDSETDKVLGLELGADDYLTKPFSPRELLARVKAVLRRAYISEEQKVLSLGELQIDLEKCEAKLSGKVLPLTKAEFKILTLLASHPGRVYSRERLCEEVSGEEVFGECRAVDVHIKYLREKLGDDPYKPRFIETVRGFGYRFVGRKNV